MSRAHRRLTVFALTFALAVPAAWGRSRQRQATTSPPSVASLLFSLAARWSGFGLPGGWFKEGCMVDPLGRCLKTQGPSSVGLIGPNGPSEAKYGDESRRMVGRLGHITPWY
jgi:hypothetical protein